MTNINLTDQSDVDFLSLADERYQASKRTLGVYTSAVNANQAVIKRLLTKVCAANQLDFRNFSDYSFNKTTGVITLVPKP